MSVGNWGAKVAAEALLKISKCARWLLAALALAVQMAQPAAAQDDAEYVSAHANAGRYAFLPDIFIDLERGWETYHRRYAASAIRVCSTSELNCLFGATFRVVWPKACDFYDIGERWEAGEGEDAVASEVVSSFTRRGRHSITYHYVMRTEGVDDFLYIVMPTRGLIGVIHDPEERGVLASRAADETLLAELSRAGSDTADGFAVSYLAGGANVEVCESIY